MFYESLTDEREAEEQPEIVETLRLNLFKFHHPATATFERRVLPRRCHTVFEQRVIHVLEFGRGKREVEHAPEVLDITELVDKPLTLGPAYTFLRARTLVYPKAPPVL
eukprot:CAMPEP_0194510082 /NCGR_PEP_ID=MMETSP0253-20130528/41396_2 /TAXON_ID=2966 /ORGANISM="Noctiluca scintillans" /LENGTH=107 /DNA_ID=CAMNT_0039353299 /DNA_START=449 /DNA_END=772 /DNA_ORIENTATION=-